MFKYMFTAQIFPIKATHAVVFPKSHAMSREEGEGVTRFPIFKSRTAIPYSQCSDYSPDFEQFIDMPSSTTELTALLQKQ